ncbi:MAG: hypothetical protein HFJ12_06005 [Bacilli bacterium]|nr:hypothetical protein [Bacilli bacterium]
MEISRLTIDVEKKLNNLSEEERYGILQLYYANNQSGYYFPNDLVAFYPQMKEQKASKEIVCNISETIISKGSCYINYRPILENLNTHEVYVLKRTIKCLPYYSDILPVNIRGLEHLNDMIINTSIDSCDLNLECLRHYGEIKLLKLKRKGRSNYENSNRK